MQNFETVGMLARLFLTLLWLPFALSVKECLQGLTFNAVVETYLPSLQLSLSYPVTNENDCVKLCYADRRCEGAYLSRELGNVTCTLSSYSHVSCPVSLSAYETVVPPSAQTVLLHCIQCRNEGKVNVVVLWNRLVQRIVAREKLQVPESTRVFAVVHSAAQRSYATLSRQSPLADCLSREEIGIAAAAHTALVYLFPSNRPEADELLRSVFANSSCADASRDATYLVGLEAAMKLLEERAKDSSQCFADYRPRDQPGAWRPPPRITDPSPLLPCWGNLSLFGDVGSVELFLPKGPPPPESETFQRNWEEMIVVGGRDSLKRTAYQTEAAALWHSPTFVNLLNQLIADVLNQQTSVDDHKSYIRAFWLANMAAANAAVVVWRTKYRHDNWRPETALTSGMSSHPTLEIAAAWESFLDTPVSPDYVSGHSGVGYGVATVLARLYGDEQTFVVTDGHSRSHYFRSLSVAALELALSRVWGGVDWRYSCDDGRSIGRKMAEAILAHNAGD